MKAKDIREKSPIEIEKLLAESREGVRKLRFELASRQTKGHRAYRNLKKDIARMLTVLREL